ncbi:monovalent cation/H(+) antiporter subunit G [Candidatus Berkiella cookevillensis]|uniref:Monovalent cation/H(+) antiporter subunit G n=1 Tax=Candidatus Berkiella cookevillensis TaxID=437022 RepID=A0A0Q9YEM4_9GAMM|nr:monovalent cation/H(+) antiporter subunit G [Candidatus Berkiella cookevillensis]MCS5709338.1 monovalent cation/H(+) antiporter subunit G [Candidatus Berkiella cookevillensis]
MTTVSDLPLWAACLISILCIMGALLTLVGNLGLIRLKSFYERVHAPTLGATLGAGFILVASIIFFSMLESKLNLFCVLIAVFMTITTPATLILVVRAGMYRDRKALFKEENSEQGL